jgi:hypothetical protein
VKFLFPVFALFLFCKLCIAEEPFRAWTSSDGRTLQARFVEKVGNELVKIKTEDGKDYTLPVSRFSQEDQKYISDTPIRESFRLPEPFQDKKKGIVIIASINGKVEILDPFLSSINPAKVGEAITSPKTLITGSNGKAVIIFSNGTTAEIRSNTELFFEKIWQLEFKSSKKNVSEIKQEISPCRIALNLEFGDLVVDVKKLNKSSSFLINSPLGVAGIRGTQFGFSVDKENLNLGVLEGKVIVLDSQKNARQVETKQKLSGDKLGSDSVTEISENEAGLLRKSLEKINEVSDDYNTDKLELFMLIENQVFLTPEEEEIWNSIPKELDWYFYGDYEWWGGESVKAANYRYQIKGNKLTRANAKEAGFTYTGFAKYYSSSSKRRVLFQFEDGWLVSIKENKMSDGLQVKDLTFEKGKLSSVLYRETNPKIFPRKSLILYKDEVVIERREFHVSGKLRYKAIKSSTIYENGSRLVDNSWYENGQKRWVFEYKPKRRAKAWLPNGDECPITNLNDGNGIFVGYNYYGGKEKFRKVYENDELKSNIKTMWYYNIDQRRYTKEFADSSYKTIISAESWKPNGDKCPITNVKDGNGIVVEYNDNGEELNRKIYKDGREVKD